MKALLWRAFYSLLWCAILPLALVRLYWRGRKQPAYRQHIAERLGIYKQPTSLCIWVHAVSVGEVRAAQPLVQALLRHYPQHTVLISCMTPTGRATAESLFTERVQTVYLPYDMAWLMRRFVHYFKPVFGVMMETELWVNCIHTCKQQGIPLLLFNARLSEKSAKGYHKIRGLIAPALKKFYAIAAQSPQDAARLQLIGAEFSQLHVCGNLKFDVAPDETLLTLGRSWRQQWGAGRQVLMLASSREGEEAQLLAALKAYTLPAELLVLIVPRHPQRFDEVYQQAQQQGWAIARWSDQPAISPHTQILLGDSMGQMAAYYAAADVVLMGGTFADCGGQNLIEACAVGLPVVLGPSTYNFAQASDWALTAGAACQVADMPAALQMGLALFQDALRRQKMTDSARQFSLQHKGALQRMLSLLPPL